MLIFSEIYTKEVESLMKKYYDSLSEKDKRRYAAIESLKINYYGEQYISKTLDISIETIERGKRELMNGFDTPQDRIRNYGGGRKKIIDSMDEITEEFTKIMENHTAGSPMNENVKWTNLTPKEISKHFEEVGLNVSVHVVKQLLKVHGYVQRKAEKDVVMKDVEDRDEQFENISRIKKEYMDSQTNPVISMDVKKKSILGISTGMEVYIPRSR
jgi:hypothetical protein